MARTTGRKAKRNTSEVETKLVRLHRPYRPVASALLFEIFVDNSPHPLLVERSFEGHTVGVSGAELLDVAAKLAGVLIFGFGAGLQRIILANENRVAFNFAPVDLEDLVLEDVGVIVEVVGWEGSGDFGEPGGDFDGTELLDLRIERFGTRKSEQHE